MNVVIDLILGLNVYCLLEEVLLENVDLILEAFDYLQLPFALKQGIAISSAYEKSDIVWFMYQLYLMGGDFACW